MPRRPLMLVPLLLAVLLAAAPRPRPAVAQPAPSGGTGGAALAGVAPMPLTGERRAAFETYLAEAMQEFGMVGAEVAVVQGGETVYLQGFGVTELGGSAPVTPDTLMAIGSVTKSMTSMMAATVIDDGWLSWDTPVVDLLPDFAVADPALTPRITMGDSFCACTGLPRRDVQLVLDMDHQTPERLISSVSEMPLTAPFRQTYQYSNQMYATGGFAATVAAGGARNDLARDYRLAMRQRILGPIGMTRSTFDLQQVLADGNYALPHAVDISGQTRRFPIFLDARFLSMAAPAGGLWSSAREMARYIETQIAGGVAPDGGRVVSAANLERTRTPGVAMPPSLLGAASQYYGMGWELGDYHGQPLVSHSGGALGFAAEVAFMPAANLGVVILSNGGTLAAPFLYAAQFRLFELLFGLQPEFQATVDRIREATASANAALLAQTGPVDPPSVAGFEGWYENPVMGHIHLALRDGRLILEAGELRSSLVAQHDEAGNSIGYLFADPPLAGPAQLITLLLDEAGQPEVVMTVRGEVAESVDELPAAENSYIFTPVDPGSAPTPP